jgi:phage-related protein
VVSQVAKKITLTSYPSLNSIDDPIETDDAFQNFYASGQRAWFGLEMGGNHTVRGLGASSVYEIRDFEPYPFQREGIRMNLNSMSKQTKITLPDTQDRAIRNVVSSGLDFRGKRCVLRRLFANGDPLDSGSSMNLIDGYIQDWTASSDQGIIVFSIAHSVIDIRGKFPPRTLSLNCGHKFRGTRCMYAGTSGSCDHTKPRCEELNNVLQFGGFPTVSARQRRVLWR